MVSIPLKHRMWSDWGSLNRLNKASKTSDAHHSSDDLMKIEVLTNLEERTDGRQRNEKSGHKKVQKLSILINSDVSFKNFQDLLLAHFWIVKNCLLYKLVLLLIIANESRNMQYCKNWEIFLPLHGHLHLRKCCFHDGHMAQLSAAPSSAKIHLTVHFSTGFFPFARKRFLEYYFAALEKGHHENYNHYNISKLFYSMESRFS